MPPPNPEFDLKRRARRRLIGAVVLILLAVIVLPLLLEDEPPPASSLAVKMAVLPVAEEPDVDLAPKADAPVQTEAEDTPVPVAATPSKPEPEIKVIKPQEPKPAPPKPRALDPQPLKPAVQPVDKPVAKPITPAPSEAKPAASGKTFVVQLAALADSAKAQTLKARAAETGLPTYTDKVGNLTRVRVGPFATHDAATAAALKLANNGMPGQVTAK
ncbi:MAG: SPOR domain-containing protein [Thiobacillus sp.]|nr:SPOR domain-containing protein [Thiobacillus sp.]